MSETSTEAPAMVSVPAGELAAFGKLLERAEKALAGAVEAERERIRLAVEGQKFTLFREGSGTGQSLAILVVPLEGLLKVLEGGPS
jgi:hypothetical protein